VPQRAVLARAAIAVTHAGLQHGAGRLVLRRAAGRDPARLRAAATAARLRYAGVAESSASAPVPAGSLKRWKGCSRTAPIASAQRPCAPRSSWPAGCRKRRTSPRRALLGLDRRRGLGAVLQRRASPSCRQ
jgi:hypothetical protein